MNQADVSVGIPAMVNCLILVPFSVFFHYAYDVGPYIIDHKSVPEHGEPQYLHYQGGFLGGRAFLGMLNPGEMLGAIGLMFKMVRGRRRQSDLPGRGYDTATSTEGRDAGRAHEMPSSGRRDQRRMDSKHGVGGHSRGYDQRRGEDVPYGWTTTPQNGGYGSGQHQQGHR